MRVRGLIELTDRMDRDLLDHLAAAAYGAARDGTIVLVLREVSLPRIEGVLDPLVQRHRWSRGGVVYRRSGEGDRELASLAAAAEFVVADSREWASALEAMGIRAMSPAEGLVYLEGGLAAIQA